MACRMPIAMMVCSSTVKWWYMLYCICATTRPKSGTKRPKTPASLSRRRVVSGSFSEVSICRKVRLASGSSRSARSISLRFWVTQRSALGWTSRSWAWATWNSRSSLTGSALKSSGPFTVIRSPSTGKPPTRRRRPIRALPLMRKRAPRPCSISSAAQKIRVREPTSLATRK